MKPRKAEIGISHPREARPVPIVADAAISTRGVHGGRQLPVLLLDTSERPDIAEYIRIHENLGPGDHKYQWGQIKGHDGTVAVLITCIRPMQLFFVLEFDIVKQGILVEQALTGEGIYLTRAESPNDRLINNFDRPKVIFELGDSGFRKYWDEIFRKRLVAHFREGGMGRSESRQAARSLIEQMRKIGSFRMPDIRG
jgi:hypothetical protein